MKTLLLLLSSTVYCFGQFNFSNPAIVGQALPTAVAAESGSRPDHPTPAVERTIGSTWAVRKGRDQKGGHSNAPIASSTVGEPRQCIHILNGEGSAKTCSCEISAAPGPKTTDSAVNASVPSAAPPTLIAARILTNGAMQFTFTNSPGAMFAVLATTNLSLPMSNWISLGVSSEIGLGQFVFTDPHATNGSQRFYRLRSP